jgi:hypothetical protein
MLVGLEGRRSGKLLLVLASTVVLGSKSRGTHGHILSELRLFQREITGKFRIEITERHSNTRN